MHETVSTLATKEHADSEQTSLVFHVHDESVFQRPLMLFNCKSCDEMTPVDCAGRMDVMSFQAVDGESNCIVSRRELCDVTFNKLPAREVPSTFELCSGDGLFDGCRIKEELL